MADDRKIVIELTALGSDDEDEDEKESDEEKDSKKRSKKIKSVTKQLIGQGFQILETQVLYQLDKYTSLTDDYRTSIMVDNIKTTISKVKSLGTTIITGAKVASTIGGPVGIGLGVALVGAYVVSEGLSISRQYQTQALNLNLADKEAKYARTRLGLIDNGRGTQN